MDATPDNSNTASTRFRDRFIFALMCRVVYRQYPKPGKQPRERELRLDSSPDPHPSEEAAHLFDLAESACDDPRNLAPKIIRLELAQVPLDGNRRIFRYQRYGLP